MGLMTSSHSAGLSCQSKPFLKTPLVVQQLAVCIGKIPESLEPTILEKPKNVSKAAQTKEKYFLKRDVWPQVDSMSFEKKEKKRNLYCYFSNVKKRTRIVTRLSPSRAECLGLCSTPWAPSCPRRVTQTSLCVCAPLSRAWVQTVPHFPAFCLQTDASLLLLPFKGHHLSALSQFQPVHCITCVDPATLRFCFLHSFKSKHCI